MQIGSIWTRFEAIECKFEQFDRDSNHSNANLKQLNAISNHLKGILTIRIQIQSIQSRFEAIECKFEKDSYHSNANSKHSNEIRSNRMQIGAIQQGF